MADVVPVDPAPLNLNGLNYTVPKPDTTGMFDNLEKMAQIRNLMNQNAIFQQTFEAKQRAGQIMATSPDVDTGLKRLQQDPLTASFAPELMNSYRQLDLTNTQVQSTQQGMYGSGFHEVLKSLPSAYTDMGSFNRAMQMRIGTLSPMTQDYLKSTGAVTALQKALFDGLPDDPAARDAMYRQRWNAMMLGADFNPESINAVVGKNTQIDQGNQIQPGIERPSALGGGFAPAGAPVPKTGIAPQVAQGPNNVPLVIGGNVPPAGGNALGAGSAPAAGVPQLAGDGTPLIPPGFQPSAGNRTDIPSQMNPTGSPVMTPANAELNHGLVENYGKEGLKGYMNAQATMGMLDYMDSDLDNLGKVGGFTAPGTAAKFRNAVANAANTAAVAMGQKPPFDPTAVASAESFIKATRTMGLSVLTTMLGNQREAAQTISNITEAVPNVDNSYLGGKMLTSTFRAATKRIIDERDFDNHYMQQTGGSLIGAAEAFNKLHPPEQYADGVLNQFGFKSDGKFKDPQTVLGYINKGYLTPEQGKKILNTQFPGGPNAHGAAAAPQRLLPDQDEDANALGASQ